VWVVLGDRPVGVDGQRAGRAGVDERGQPGVHRRVQDVPQPFDVGAEQRRGIAQPHPRIDDAVVHDIASGHRIAQGRIVENVSVATLYGKILDTLGGARPAQHDTDVGALGNQLTGDVRADDPLAPITSFLPMCGTPLVGVAPASAGRLLSTIAYESRRIPPLTSRNPQ
jgi:hypothetical protein